MKSRKSNLSEFRFYPVLLVIGVVLLILALMGVLNPFLKISQTLTLPVQVGFYRLTSGIGDLVTTATQIGSLQSDKANLRVENATLQAENAILKRLEAENQSLREQLATPLKNLKVKQTARVIGTGGFGTKNVLLLDKGSDNTLKKGDFVIVKNILLGQLIEVTPKIASVQLLSDPDTKIPVKTDSGFEGILEGRFGSGMELTNILQSATLKDDEMVYTSGKDNFPAPLVVGKIDKINKVEKEFFQSATLVPLVKPESLSVVFIAEN